MNTAHIEIREDTDAPERFRRQVDERGFGNHDALVLHAHGSKDGRQCAGLSAKELVHILVCRHIWLHSCHCGRALAPELSRLGRASYGFISPIITDDENDAGVKVTLDYFKKTPIDTAADDVRNGVQAEYFSLALDFLAAKDLIHAAAINHCRLTLRAFSPNK